MKCPVCGKEKGPQLDIDQFREIEVHDSISIEFYDVCDTCVNMVVETVKELLQR